MLLLIALVMPHLKAETVATSDDPDFIRASILISSPGNLPHQLVGHAAIRMECPTYNFDRTFSFNNNTAEDYFKMLTKGSVGVMQEAETIDYINDLKSEKRQVRSIPLNLTINQKARLWEVLDSIKTLPERSFSIPGNHCFSMAAHAIDIAIAPEYINWNEPALQQKKYYEFMRLSDNGNYPWNYLLLGLPLGTMIDSKSAGNNYIYPTIFDKEYDQFNIYSPEGSVRPLVSGQAEILVPETGDHSANRPTPVETALIILAIVVIITTLQFFRNRISGPGAKEAIRLSGKILDWVLWIFISLAGLILAYFIFGPVQYGNGWSWILLVFNPIAWVPIVVWRKKDDYLKFVWVAYALILTLFAAFIGFIAPSVDPSIRIFAVALTIRCLWHANNIYKLITI